MKTNQTPLFRRDFTLVVIGQVISLFGNAILRFALPLYLLRQTGSAALFERCSPWAVLLGAAAAAAVTSVFSRKVFCELDAGGLGETGSALLG